jgi:tetratricopeptide (TPR) repeat protein
MTEYIRFNMADDNIENIKISMEELEKTPKLCLNMIVKNESKVICRLLESVTPLIDSYCICDTGSTDDTKEIIRDFFESKNIPGKVVEEPFKDFGYNRSVALKACEDMDNADYILLLDADMVLKIGEKTTPHEFKKSLVHDVYHVFQGNDDFYYKNTRIVKNRRGMYYWGVTHEYVKSPEGSTTSRIEKDILFINDIGDGGSKADKFIRDINLLTKGLEENPNNDRYTFYLANSYRDSGNYEKAIEYFKKRIDIGGWYEEIWFSYYSIGKCYKHMNDMPNAIYYWLEGYNFFPNRIENLYEIVSHYRHLGKNRLAYTYFTIANTERTKHPERDYLFMQKDVYDYKLDYEFTIIGYYCNDHKLNLPQYCMKVLAHSTCEEHTAKNVLSNYKFYTSRLKDWDTSVDQNSELLKKVGKKMMEPFANEFNSSTPSMCINDKGDLVVNIRYVNYKIDDNGGYVNKEHIETKNIIGVFDISNPLEWKQKDEFLLQYNNEIDNLYVGLEDVRIHSYNGNVYYNANRGLSYHNIKVEHGVIDMNEGVTNSGIISKSAQHDVEKNWVIFNDANNSQKMIYGWHPLVIGNVESPTRDFENMEYIHTHAVQTPVLFRFLRGSTNGVTIGNEIWFICHAVSYEDRRYYYHIFVVLDAATYQLKKYSTLFTFEKEKVEYTLGFIHIKDTNQFYIGYSLMDRETHFMTVSKRVVDGMMITV